MSTPGSRAALDPRPAPRAQQHATATALVHAPAFESSPVDVAAQVDPGRISAFAAFASLDFRTFWTGLWVSNTGTWLHVFAQGWLIVELARRAGEPSLAGLWLGIAGLARAVPGIALSLPGGAFADRVDRRRALVVLYGLSALLTLSLAALAAVGQVSIPVIVGYSALASVLFAFESPTRHLFVGRLVPKHHLMSAIGLASAALNGPQLVGAVLAGLLFVAVGPAGLFALNALSSLVLMVAVGRVRATPPRGPAAPRLGLRATLGAMRRDPVMGPTLLVAAAVALSAGSFAATLPVTANQILGAGARETSWLMAAAGAGAFAGALLSAALGGVRRRGRLFLTLGALVGLALVLFGLTPDLAPALAVAVLVGLANAAFMNTANTILQSAAPERSHGRMQGAYTLLVVGLIPLGQFASGLLATRLGPAGVLHLAGALSILAMVVAAWRVPALRGLHSTRVPHAHPHAAGAHGRFHGRAHRLRWTTADVQGARSALVGLPGGGAPGMVPRLRQVGVPRG